MARGARHLDTAAARGDGESVTRRGVNDAAAPGPKDEQAKSKSGTPYKKTEENISKAGKTRGAKRPAEDAGCVRLRTFHGQKPQGAQPRKRLRELDEEAAQIKAAAEKEARAIRLRGWLGRKVPFLAKRERGPVDPWQPMGTMPLQLTLLEDE